ncbi:LOW QUALITY PROTEIN: hypothetical protein HZS_5242 [Henneguya salminicola]|nr:LOW QUALITY PROTEIN: hypothetical protein HZS_5242 [Henneguya salminicola]
MQEYTQTGGVRPFGISVLIMGIDDGKPMLFQCDPRRVFCMECHRNRSQSWCGKNIFIKKLSAIFWYKEDLELGDAIHLALITMKECFEGIITPENVEIAICTPTEGTKLLTRTTVKEYVDSAIS